MKRKRYDDDFKRDTVRKLVASGMPVSSFAASVRIEHSIVHRWLKKYRSECVPLPVGENSPTQRTDELAEVRREIAAIKSDVAVLLNILRKVLGEKYRDKTEVDDVIGA